MRLGLFAMNYGTCADPAAAVRVARAAEAAGFESLWTGEHVVLPYPKPEGFSIPPELPFLDTIAALTLLATATERVRIASGIIELPLHNPVLLAKQLASVDVISNGRLIAGFGAGYVEPEFDAVGVNLSERGVRMDEHLDALIELWTGDPPQYSGRTVSVSGRYSGALFQAPAGRQPRSSARLAGSRGDHPLYAAYSALFAGHRGRRGAKRSPRA